MEDNRLLLGNIKINHLSTDGFLNYLVDNYSDYQEYLLKLFTKFFKRNWGSISKKDVVANNIGIDGVNLVGIYALYKSRKFGNIIIKIDPEDDCLFVGYLPYHIRGKASFQRSPKTV